MDLRAFCDRAPPPFLLAGRADKDPVPLPRPTTPQKNPPVQPPKPLRADGGEGWKTRNRMKEGMAKKLDCDRVAYRVTTSVPRLSARSSPNPVARTTYR